MEKIAHSLHAEVFLYPTEDVKKVKKALDFLFPNAKFSSEKIESFYGPEITKFEYFTKKQSEITKFLKKILDDFKIHKEIFHTIDDRLNEKGDFFLRFNKQAAYNGKLKLAYHGDIIKVTIKIVTFPFSLKKTKEKITELFK